MHSNELSLTTESEERQPLGADYDDIEWEIFRKQSVDPVQDGVAANKADSFPETAADRHKNQLLKHCG
jgi:hypothetical protein